VRALECAYGVERSYWSALVRARFLKFAAVWSECENLALLWHSETGQSRH
jgi:hypothetical protein